MRTETLVHRMAKTIYDAELPTASFDKRGRLISYDNAGSSSVRSFVAAAEAVVRGLGGVEVEIPVLIGDVPPGRYLIVPLDTGDTE